MNEPERRISAREFNQNVSAARRAANDAPVIVTDRGRPSHVLLTYSDYERLSKAGRTALTMFADNHPEADFDFDPTRDKTLPDNVE